MKKILFIIFVALMIAGCAKKQQQDVSKMQIANPAAVFCEEKGYKYEIRTTEQGQDGYCVFRDGKECPGWEYYRGECNP